MGAVEFMNTARIALESAQDIIEEVMGEEQDAYDNMPEGVQESERGETVSDNVDMLEQAFDNIEEAVSNLGEDIENLSGM